ncbi:MAG: hypothetical protein AAFO07_28350 [Bacteroidota bacterium]
MKTIHFVPLLLLLGIISCQKNQTPKEYVQELVQELLYIANNENGFDIMRNDTSGQNETKFTNGLGWEWGPQFVVAKNEVYYNSTDTASTFIFQNSNRKGEVLNSIITPDSMGYDISPDGKWMLFSQKIGESTQLILAPYAMPIDSQQITNNNAYNGRAKWSNDSKKIAYLSDESGSNEIYIYSMETQEHQRITNNDLREKYLSWSADDSKLATTMKTDSTENEIYLIDLNTLEVEQLTNTPINESEIACSPDGKFIAYHAQVDEKDDIYLLNISNRQLKIITDGRVYVGEPAWIWTKK